MTNGKASRELRRRLNSARIVGLLPAPFWTPRVRARRDPAGARRLAEGVFRVLRGSEAAAVGRAGHAGQGFEALQLLHWLAHRVEHKTCNLGVAGSTPAPDRLKSDSRPTESRASCRPARPSPRPRPRGWRQRRAPMRFAPRRIPPGWRGRSQRPRRPRPPRRLRTFAAPGARPSIWAQAAVRVIVVARRPAILLGPPWLIASRSRCWSSA